MTNRYVIKFSKTGYIKYTSHLDLMRSFKRTFKMAKLGLRYSQGFNPHPKMSFAQPLSLGYSSRYELIEFETNEHLKPVEILDRIDGKLPEGIDKALSSENLMEICSKNSNTNPKLKEIMEND